MHVALLFRSSSRIELLAEPGFRQQHVDELTTYCCIILHELHSIEYLAISQHV
ncbi:hypothetical protein HMPREF0496_2326 [Lentilactobacillus hilgardii ATCC 27305]|nr:hypothetical protein HMPREF0496_2326 [Lentilactobacillus hilgardii ATCC 27305]